MEASDIPAIAALATWVHEDHRRPPAELEGGKVYPMSALSSSDVK